MIKKEVSVKHVDVDGERCFGVSFSRTVSQKDFKEMVEYRKRKQKHIQEEIARLQEQLDDIVAELEEFEKLSPSV